MSAVSSAAPAGAKRDHRFRLRVYIEDTDALGFVYYANYLKFAERARSEMLRDLGLSHGALIAEGFALVVRRCHLDFRRPARLEDELTIVSRLVGLRRASFALDQAIEREGEALCRIGIEIAGIGRDGRPARLPDDLRQAFATFA